MRATVWNFLMARRVKSLPLDPIGFAKAIGYLVYDYNEGAEVIEQLKLEDAASTREGFSTRYNGKPCILYSPALIRRRRNHVILHELGHCIENHDSGGKTFGDADDVKIQMQQEDEAEEYALEAVPTPVLYKAGLTTAKDIQRVTQLDDDAVNKILSRVTQYEYIAFGVEENEICAYFHDYIREHKRVQGRQVKRRRIAAIVAGAAALALAVAGTTVALMSLGQQQAPVTSVASVAAPAITSEISALPQGQIVYWTDSGDVYHIDRNCQHIRNRTNVHSGTVAESGKDRVCKTCG